MIDTVLARLFPYAVTVSALAIGFMILILVLIAQRMLLPGIVIIGTFMLFVLWLAGLIETSIQLFGTSGVNSLCTTYISDQQFTGVKVETLAWLEQKNICESRDIHWLDELYGSLIMFRQLLVCSFCIRGCRNDFSLVDDGYGISGESG